MTKVYGIYGRTTVELTLQVGKATLPLVFERGCLDRKNFRPAVYMTSKPAIQAMIENSPLFGTTIQLVRTFGAREQVETTSAVSAPIKKAPVEKVATPTAAGPNPAPTVTEAPEVTSLAEAAAYLKAHGAKAANVAGEEAMKKYMAKIGVIFPNFNF